MCISCCQFVVASVFFFVFGTVDNTGIYVHFGPVDDDC